MKVRSTDKSLRLKRLQIRKQRVRLRYLKTKFNLKTTLKITRNPDQKRDLPKKRDTQQQWVSLFFMRIWY